MSNGQHYDWKKLMQQVGGKVESRLLRHLRQRKGDADRPASDDPFECESCGERYPVSDRCVRCGLPTIHRATGRRIESWIVTPAHSLRLVERSRTALRDTRRDAKRARALAGARKKLRRGRRVRFKGIVSVIRGVVEPTTSKEVGAYLVRRRVKEPCGHGEECKRENVEEIEESAIGLLAVHAGDVVILVGLPRSVQRVWRRRRSSAAAIVVRDGQEIEVVGLLDECTIELPGATSYRDGPEEQPPRLCLVGTFSAPCLVLA